MNKNLSNVLKAFGITSGLYEIKPISGGIVNSTYLILKNHRPLFILQSMNASINPAVLETWVEVSKVCNAKGLLVPSIKRTEDDELSFLDTDQRWRMIYYIPNLEARQSKASLESAAGFLAEFHKALASHKFVPKAIVTDHFHDAFFVANKVDDYVRETNIAGLGKTISVGIMGIDLGSFNLQLIHGDPKWNNFLFNQNGLVIAIIDLDTVMLGNVLTDLGDALRSWSKTADYGFDSKKFDIALSAYNLRAENVISRDTAIKATSLITYELAGRFLIDYFEDLYFGWDKKLFSSRREHNLFRANAYARLAKIIR